MILIDILIDIINITLIIILNNKENLFTIDRYLVFPLSSAK